MLLNPAESNEMQRAPKLPCILYVNPLTKHDKVALATCRQTANCWGPTLWATFLIISSAIHTITIYPATSIYQYHKSIEKTKRHMSPCIIRNYRNFMKFPGYPEMIIKSTFDLQATVFSSVIWCRPLKRLLMTCRIWLQVPELSGKPGASVWIQCGWVVDGDLSCSDWKFS